MREGASAIKIGSLVAVAASLLRGGPARAHASEQGFVLLLPTDVYIAAGVSSVAVTVLLLAILPGQVTLRLFGPIRTGLRLPQRGDVATGMAASLALCALIWIGASGSRDPLANLLPLTIWTIWWIALVSLQGLFGDLWRWSNPWTTPALMVRRWICGAVFRLPASIGYAPGLLSFLGFAAFLLADPAPSDPVRLAGFVLAYSTWTIGGLILFGRRWLVRAEWITMLMRLYARVAFTGAFQGRIALGLPG